MNVNLNIVPHPFEPSSAPSSKYDYLAGCRSREKAAWNKFYADFADRIYKWVLFLGLNPVNAEEVTQEVFLAAYRKIDTCESEAQLKSWLFQIARKQAANFRRNSWFKRFWGSRHSASMSPHALNVTDSDNISPEIKQALDALSQKQIEVLLLHDLEGFTQKEIAASLNVPMGTVASRLRKARKRFTEKWREI